MNKRPFLPAAPRRKRARGCLSGGALAAGLLLPAPLLAQGDGATPAGVPPAAPAGQGAALQAATPVTLNFVNAEIEAVTRAIGAMLNRAILVDPRVKGQITVYNEQPLPVRDAYLNYLAALRGLGFTVVENAGLLKVVPEAEAKLQAGTVSIGAVSQRGDQIMTQIFRLNYETPNNLVAILRPLISPNNTINANQANSSLVVTDYADNLQRIAKIVAALDQPATTDVEIVPLRHAVASDIAAVVQRLAEGGAAGSSQVPGAPPAVATAAGGSSVVADPRSNSLIVRAGNPAKLAQIRALIDKLDRPIEGGGPGGNIYVVYLRNADATRLATVLRASFAVTAGGSGASAGAGGSGSSGGSTPALGTSTSAQSSLSSSISSGSSSSFGGSGTSAAATTPVSAAAQPSTGGFVQADPATNSLIITAPEPMYRQIRTVIDQLDSRRAQVYVESMIVKIDANKAAEIGFQWQGLLGRTSGNNYLLSGTNFGTSNSNIVNLAGNINNGNVAVDSSLNGLNLAFVRRVGSLYTMAALARFLETNTGANVLSTPNLVALDNEEAKIVIGQNVPFITGSFTNTGTGTGAINPFQTIERKDVGLTLRIKSQIGEGGTVRMTIFQENSAVVPGATTSAGPTTDKSSVETTVVVDDGQIMVLGGLLKDEYTDGEDRVPGLASIPVLGNLFRAENRKRIKSNLMVFLRPVVIRTPEAAESLTMDRYESIRTQQQGTQPAPSAVMPINESPVLPPLRPPAEVGGPVVPTPLEPAPSTPEPAPVPQAPPASAPQTPPIIDRWRN